ncbi:hypothetical protein [Streptomyces sp. NPDC008317]|uniref:hypothetical protein n=1 Tax=Streptomyces sp. NPDC008317 TaxID=3364827 RepID=UPI0036E14A4E
MRRTAKLGIGEDGTVVSRTDFVWDGTRLAEQIVSTGYGYGYGHGSGYGDGDGYGDGTVAVTTWDALPGSHRPVGQTERVQGLDGAARLRGTGEPWPLEMRRAHARRVTDHVWLHVLDDAATEEARSTTCRPTTSGRPPPRPSPNGAPANAAFRPQPSKRPSTGRGRPSERVSDP